MIKRQNMELAKGMKEGLVIKDGSHSGEWEKKELLAFLHNNEAVLLLPFSAISPVNQNQPIHLKSLFTPPFNSQSFFIQSVSTSLISCLYH